MANVPKVTRIALDASFETHYLEAETNYFTIENESISSVLVYLRKNGTFTTDYLTLFEDEVREFDFPCAAVRLECEGQATISILEAYRPPTSGGAGTEERFGVFDVPQSVYDFDVTFSAFVDTTYTASMVLENTTDPNPNDRLLMLTDKQTNQITVRMSNPVYTANYKLHWSVKRG